MQQARLQRVALVTGGARRVGAAIVRRLTASGIDVVFTYQHSQTQAQELAKECSSPNSGRKVVAVRTDLLDPSRAAGAIEAVIQRDFHDRLDVIVNSASIYLPTPIDQPVGSTPADMYTIHVTAPLTLVQRFTPQLKYAKGHVINMVDILAERPWPAYWAYCASKAALWNLTLSLAKELAPDVTVNGIAPGVVEWPESYSPDDRENYLKRVPLRRAGSPWDVANLVDYLVSDGSYLTGQIIRLDGGRSTT